MEQDTLSEQALENLPVSVFIFNREQEIIKFNKHFAREYYHVFGKGLITNKLSLKNAFDKNLQRQLSHAWSRALKGGPFSQIVSFNSKDILYNWEFTYEPINNSFGEPSNVAVILKDVSSEVSYQQQPAKTGAWEKDLATGNTYWAPELYHIFDIDESLEIKDIDLYTYFKNGDILKAAVEECKLKGKPFDLKLNITTGEGKDAWVRAIGKAQMEAGKVKKIYGVFQDITEQYQLSNQLSRRNELLNLFFENIDMVYIALDEKWNICFINKQAAKIIGNQEVIGKNIWEIVPFVQSDQLKNAAKKLAGQQQINIEVKLADVVEWYDLSLVQMKDGGISLFGWNFSESKKLQAELRESNEQLRSLNDYLASQNKQMQEFTNISSHNLRSPVANMKGILSLIEMAENEEEKSQYINMLSGLLDKVDDTLHDLLEISRLRNTMNIEKETLSFEEILSSIKEILYVDIATSGTKINKNFEKVPFIEYPRVYMESIFLNLISNSIKYSKPSLAPLIDIETYYEDNRVCLRISDNGSGMDMEKVKNSLFGFGKTFHLNKDAKGLGLYIIKNQIEAMGGNIYVDSILGEGTTFNIKF